MDSPEEARSRCIAMSSLWPLRNSHFHGWIWNGTL